MKNTLTRVLIIDDDSAMTDLLKLMLEPARFQVIAINSGKEGIEAARTKFPHVIILDLLIPGMDGWEVCKAIRSFSDVPILVLSALNEPNLVTKALNEGADDVLIKPVPANVLTAYLNKLTRRARAEIEAAAKSSTGQVL